jgi:integrase
METKFRFTKNALAAITCPPEKSKIRVSDTEVPGLVMLVTRNGSRAYYHYKFLNGKPSECRIGPTAEVTIENARKAAAAMNNGAALGIDPQAGKREARRQQSTIGDLWQSYLEGHLCQHKPENVDWYKRRYDAHLAVWKDKPIKDIDSQDVENLKLRIAKSNGRYTANRVVELLRAMYRSRGYLFGLPKKYSPTTDVELFEEKARDRVLKPDELGRFIAALDQETNDTVKDFFRMSLYTGARKSNVKGMRWQDISLQRCEWKLPGVTMKNGAPLIVPLVPEAIEVLERRSKETPEDSPFVFPRKQLTPEQVKIVRELRQGGATTRAIAEQTALSQTAVMRALNPKYTVDQPQPFNGTARAWKRLLAASKITERTTIHDLRRTYCTSMIEAGAPLPYVAQAMGHRDMETTQKHYAIARQDNVKNAVHAGVAGMLAAAKRALKSA